MIGVLAVITVCIFAAVICWQYGEIKYKQGWLDGQEESAKFLDFARRVREDK